MLQLAKSGELEVPTKYPHISLKMHTRENYQHWEVTFDAKSECSSDDETKRKSKDSSTKATVNTKDMFNLISIK